LPPAVAVVGPPPPDDEKLPRDRSNVGIAPALLESSDDGGGAMEDNDVPPVLAMEF